MIYQLIRRIVALIVAGLLTAAPAVAVPSTPERTRPAPPPVAGPTPDHGRERPSSDDRESSMIFDAEFTGAAGSAPNSALWWLKLTDEWQPAPELQTYTADPANAHLDGAGHLAITALARGDGWTSARLHSRAFVQYGRIEARIKAPTAAGVWPAFWLLGDDSVVGWPACGEIDVMEAPAAEGGRVFAGTHQPGDGGQLVDPLQLADPGGWHTYAVDWRPGRIDFYTDDQPRGTVTRAAIEATGGVWPFDSTPQQIILNVAVGGWGGTPGAWSSQTMLIDYVRVTG